MASETYYIQLTQNPNLCIGAQQIASGAQLELKLLSESDLSTQWTLCDNGNIVSAGNPDLCIDAQGINSNQGTAYLTMVAPGRLSQRWNWVGQPPYITNDMYPTLVLDNANDNPVVGNQVYIWQMHSGENQQWTLLTLDAARKLAEAAATA